MSKMRKIPIIEYNKNHSKKLKMRKFKKFKKSKIRKIEIGIEKMKIRKIQKFNDSEKIENSMIRKK